MINKLDPSANLGNSAKTIVPVIPYIREIPNNKMPDEKAEERIIFMAASEERFFIKSKLDMAAIGIVANSKDK
jgi:hypothetical protein